MLATTLLGNDEVFKKESIEHKGLSYEIVISPYTKRVWLDRNLGAKSVCDSFFGDVECYGEYYYWGREDSNKDLNITYEKSLWQGVDGKNNPCPKGFRIPTKDELEEERLKAGIFEVISASESFLKLPAAGYGEKDGSTVLDNFWGHVWSSSNDGESAISLDFFREDSALDSHSFDSAFSVRCIKD